MKKKKFQPNFIVNEAGKRIGVMLDMKAYEALMEEVEDAHDLKRADKVMAKKGKTHTLEALEKSLLKKKK